MKLYDGGRAPNPRRVRIFLAEKGITVPAEQLDLGALQHRTDAYTAINPMQRVGPCNREDVRQVGEVISAGLRLDFFRKLARKPTKILLMISLHLTSPRSLFLMALSTCAFVPRTGFLDSAM